MSDLDLARRLGYDAALFELTDTGMQILDDVANDPGVLAHMRRVAVIDAIKAATEDTPFFHAGTMREFLPDGFLETHPNSVGAIVSNLVKSGAIVDTGRTARSGNRKQRNGNRIVPVYEVVNLEGEK